MARSARIPQAPPPGVFRNATPAATPGKWWDTNNIRFIGGLTQPTGGNMALPNTAVPDIPRDCITWHDNTYQRWAAYGTDTGLYAYNFNLDTLYTITPAGVGPLAPPGVAVGFGMGNFGAGDFGTARDVSDLLPQDVSASQGDMWSMATYGEWLMIVPTQDGRLFSWHPATPGTLPQVVPNAPLQNRGVAVTDQRSVVLLGAGGDPRNVAWSDQEDPATWAPAVGNLAGSKLLVTEGYGMCMAKCSQGIVILTANDAHLLGYVGPPYGYGIVEVGSMCGPISQRAICAAGSMLTWMGRKNFWTYNGNVQPVRCDVQDWLFSLINRMYVGRVFAHPNPQFSEMWWDWPDESATECNRYVLVNYVDTGRPWSIGQRTRSCGDPSGAMDLPVLGGPLGSGGALYLHEYGLLDNGAPRAPAGLIYAESGDITLGEGDTRWHNKQIAFDRTPPADGVAFEFFLREQPNGPERSTGLFKLLRSDGLIDARFSCRSARMRVESTIDETWALGRPRLIMRPGGRR
jgi:hypothetical protein